MYLELPNCCHRRMRLNVFSCICVYVCLSVMLWLLKVLTQKDRVWYASTHVQNLHVKFVSQGRWVKVTSAKSHPATPFSDSNGAALQWRQVHFDHSGYDASLPVCSNVSAPQGVHVCLPCGRARPAARAFFKFTISRQTTKQQCVCVVCL